MSLFARLILDLDADGRPNRRTLDACPQITITPTRGGDTHYRVHLCSHHDWSGWAPTREAAIERALARADSISCDCETATAWNSRRKEPA